MPSAQSAPMPWRPAEPRPQRLGTSAVQGLWKVFGAKAARHRMRRGMDDGSASQPTSRRRPGASAAVRDVSFDVRQRRGVRRDGPVRLGQVDAGALPDPADRADRRAGACCSGEDIAAAAPDELRELRRRKVSMVFQHFGLLPHRRVIDNVAYGLEIRGDDKKDSDEAGPAR